MSTAALQKLIDGYKQFREHYVSKQYGAYRAWAGQTQEPAIMMISCSDSRVNPAILTHAGLGEVFMVNNVANLVPPFKEGKDTHHSTSAALEYAITVLKIETVIVLGHSGCGGIKALVNGTHNPNPDIYSFIGPWVEIANRAKERVLSRHGDCSLEEQATFCEKEALLVSLENLETFPWVKTAMAEGKLSLHAWYFDILSGDVFQYEPEKEEFLPLLEKE